MTSETSANLTLPFIQAAQAQKHVTHNEAIRMLDTLVHLAVASRSQAQPPAAPAEGARFIVPAGAASAWGVGDGCIAAFEDGAFTGYAPQAGWRAFVADEERLLVFDGTAWTTSLDTAGLADGTIRKLGVNTAADDFNRLAVKTSAVLISHDDVSGTGNGSVLGTFNKQAAGKDAGFNFQTGYSTRALMGLYGDDDFRLKVSPDGSAFFDALSVDRASGRVTFAQAGAVKDMVTGLFRKADAGSVAFIRTGSASLQLKAGTLIEVAGLIHSFTAATSITMPALAAGTDYAVYACSDGSLRADANFSAPSGYTTANSRQIGGFHYAPGGNATGYNTGGDAVPQINPYSLWDLKWRPACADPRGMALVAGRFWCDIYLTGVNVDADGSSRSGVTIADGSNPPKVPAMFGGDGTTTYGSFTWYEAVELLGSTGKCPLDYADFAAAAFGTKEAVSRGNDPVTTGLGTTNAGSSNADQSFTSKWGICQSSGCLWIWGNEFGGPNAGAAWADTVEGRGQVYNQPNVVLLGADWTNGVIAGSRASGWATAPSDSIFSVGARGRCDHLHLP
ncbi:DUF2793 domain-containing protein [Jiella sp. M17.18]|uniref:phage major tropism determinant n=1 Tax=Jiella sp. M17.18 TaxID=3234247 RepID=UPI0034DFA274